MCVGTVGGACMYCVVIVLVVSLVLLDVCVCDVVVSSINCGGVCGGAMGVDVGSVASGCVGNNIVGCVFPCWR